MSHLTYLNARSHGEAPLFQTTHLNKVARRQGHLAYLNARGALGAHEVRKRNYSGTLYLGTLRTLRTYFAYTYGVSLGSIRLYSSARIVWELAAKGASGAQKRSFCGASGVSSYTYALRTWVGEVRKRGLFEAQV